MMTSLNKAHYTAIAAKWKGLLLSILPYVADTASFFPFVFVSLSYLPLFLLSAFPLAAINPKHRIHSLMSNQSTIPPLLLVLLHNFHPIHQLNPYKLLPHLTTTTTLQHLLLLPLLLHPSHLPNNNHPPPYNLHSILNYMLKYLYNCLMFLPLL